MYPHACPKKRYLSSINLINSAAADRSTHFCYTFNLTGTPAEFKMAAQPRIFTSPIKKDASKLPALPLADYLIGRLKENKLDKTEKIWVEDASTGVQVYFKDIEDKSKRVASALARLGFKKGDILYFVTYETAVLYLLQMGVWRLGGAVRGGYQMESEDEYVRQMREGKTKFLLVDSETYPRLETAVKALGTKVTVIAFGDLKKSDVIPVSQLLSDDGSAMPSNVAIDPRNDVVVIPNTSASTGRPKGVCHSHFSMMVLNYDAKALDVMRNTFMTPMSNYAIGSYMASASSITNGSTVVHLGKFVKEQYLQQLTKYKPGTCLMYPFVASWFARCDEVDNYDLSFLKAITVAGSVLDTTTTNLIMQKLPNVRINQVYGMTELITISNSGVDSAADKGLVTCENQGELCVSSGKIVPYVEVKVIDVKTGKMLGPHQRGQFHVKTPMLMLGYLREGCEEPVMEVLDNDGWLITGDIGFFDDDENIYVKERTSFMFKYFMFIISPTEIESVVQQHPAVLEVGVVDIPHPESTSVARAFVRRKPGVACTEEDLVRFVAERLPEHKQLHGGVQFVERLPESKGNKLDRLALKKLALA